MDAQERRRLLELAAKAAGCIAHKHTYDMCFYDPSTPERMFWLPLEDDGDALRLAVKLGLWLHIGKYHTAIEGIRIEESAHGDPYAATRLAIVRAAAAIGEKMEAKP